MSTGLSSERRRASDLSTGEADGVSDLSAPLGSLGAEDAEAVFGMILRLVRSVQSGMQSMDASQGMSGSQLWALWQISAQPGLRVAELAEALHIQPSTASNLLDKLELRGWVRRERRDSDNRVVRLLLTEEGINVLKEMPGPMQGRLRSVLGDLPASLRQGLREGLSCLLKNMDEKHR